MNYYNEIDSFVVKWLKELIENKLIPYGEVDDRSIAEVRGSDLKGYTQCHFFAGIGGWSRALHLAGWPEDRGIWTGSCPCQPFSVAGKGAGDKDKRHLWPEMFRLIRECNPPVVVGEQVASKLGRAWLTGVQTDLETLGYSTASADLCAAGINAPHIRQRLWWVAHSESEGIDRGFIGQEAERSSQITEPQQYSENGRLANSFSFGWRGGSERSDEREVQECQSTEIQTEGSGNIGRLAHSSGKRPHHQKDEQELAGAGEQELHTEQSRISSSSGPTFWSSSCYSDGRLAHSNNQRSQGWFSSELSECKGQCSLGESCASHWSSSCYHECKDGKARRIPLEPSLFPLAHGIPNRVGILRGAGNAIVPQVGAVFVRSFMEAVNEPA